MDIRAYLIILFLTIWTNKKKIVQVCKAMNLVLPS